MMKQRLIALLGALMLIGCTAVVPQVLAPVETAQVNTPVEEYGTLRLAVKWPTRNLPGFNTQLIPTTTNSLVIWVKDGSTELKKAVLQREIGATSASCSLRLKAANNLSIQVKAYRESNPDTEVAVAIAQGTTNANIVRSKTTNAGITLDAVFVPQIFSLSSNVGVASESITLTGDYFGDPGIPVEVLFNGAPVPPGDLTLTSTTSITVKVPAEATTGRVVVKADGVSSTSNMYCWIPQSVAINAPKASWDTFTPSDTRVVLFSKKLNFSALPSWKTKTGDNLANYGQEPPATWESTLPLLGYITDWGEFNAGAANPSLDVTAVKAALGSCVSNTIRVRPEGVQVIMNPPSNILGGRGLASIPLNAMNVFTSGATNSLLSFSSSQPTLIAATNSLAVALNFFSGGDSWIWATSQIDPSQETKVDIFLSNYYVSTFAGNRNKGFLDDPDGPSAQFKTINHLALGSDGKLYVADELKIRVLSEYGSVTSLAPSGPGLIYAVAYGADGSLYAAGYNKIYSIDKASGAATLIAGSGDTACTDGMGIAASFGRIEGMAVGPNNNIYVADDTNARIRMVTPAGMVSTVAGSVDKGHVDHANALQAQFSAFYDIAFDASGSLLIAENYTTNDNGYTAAIRKYNPETGAVSTVRKFESGYRVYSLCNGGNGETLLTYTYGGTDHAVGKITATGDFFLVAGGTNNGINFADDGGSHARFNNPRGIVRKPDGRVYVLDSLNYCIRELM